MESQAVAHALRDWFQTNGRDLPWRRGHDPYQVLLAEFVLQQTRMEVGLRYFERLLRQFPTLQALARARLSTVLAAWSGLGYYSRARNLHATARIIQDSFQGRVPSDPDVLQGLPGIGPYTAGAIASIAYDRPVPSLDGNQYRVLGRLTGNGVPTNAAQRQAMIQQAEQILAHASPRTLNQALMDLGSSVCLPATPRCQECPLVTHCKTLGAQPRAPVRPRSRTEHYQALLYVDRGKVWFTEPKGSGLLGHGWLPPLRPTKPGHRVHVEHVFSHRRWSIRTIRGRGPPPGQGKWVTRDALRKLPHSSLALRLMDIALGTEGSDARRTR